MLSLSNLKGCVSLVAYYRDAEASYYGAEGSTSAWFGRGAEALGLVGSVDDADFSAVLDGNIFGTQLRKAVSGARTGVDATFSAPKSVSLEYLLKRNKEVFQCHQAAVEKSLEFLEGLGAVRVTKGGKRVSVKADALIIARFEHDLSRNNDPQIHTHCVIANAALSEDGKWHGLDNFKIYQNKMLAGAIYRCELARQLQDLGLEVEVQHADGRFEIKGYSEELLEKFSTRSADIEQDLESLGHSRDSAHAALRKLSALKTRASKQGLDRDELYKSWLGRVGEVGLPDLQQSTEGRNKLSAISIQEKIEQTVEQLSERHSSFHEIEFLTRLTQLSVGSHVYSEVVQGYEQAIEDGLLIKSGDRLTTPELVQLERSVIDIEQGLRGQYSVGSSLGVEIFERRVRNLNAGQKLAVKAILEASDSVLAIQGRAGVGKTTLLKAASDLLEVQNKQVIALAPTTSAAKELTQSGFEGNTVASFLLRGKKSVNADTVIFLDESGLLSTNQAKEILESVRDSGCKLVMIGDEAQLSAVEAGRPFAYLQKAGMATVEVDEIQRQRNKNLKKAVGLAVEGKSRLAVQLLAKDIHEVVSPPDRYAEVAREFAGRSPDDRNSTLIVAGTRLARDRINQEVRTQLDMKDEQNLPSLSRKDLTSAQKKSILNYEKGDLLRAQVAFKSLALNRGDTIKVQSRESGCLIALTETGREVRVDPVSTNRFDVFKPRSLNVGRGDLLWFGENIHSLGVANGERATVLECKPQHNQLELVFEDGRRLSLDISKPLAMDHGYCSTVYSSQGKTCREVLIEADAHSATSNQQAFYVAISRAQERAQIFTDDREMLPHAMARDLTREHAHEVAKSREIELER